jgi:pimeloyl-ACP methyl ester carboxylesterase
MSTAIFTFCAVFAATLLCAGGPAKASDGPIAPFKDDLFSSAATLKSELNGHYRVVDYDEMRDINGRDEEVERRVKRQYVDLSPRKQQANETLSLPSGPLEIGRVGAANGQRFTVIFIHGRGGDRRLGLNDYRFGGNFNRLKNLTVRAGGTYIAPSMKSFDANGVSQLKELIAHSRAASQGQPVILACASMGSFLCYGASRDAELVANLKSMVIMGGAVDPEFPKSAFIKAKKPVFFTHGSRDKTYLAKDQEVMFRALHKSGIATRFVLFETGSHGTPIRMSDWREILNFSLFQ